jgi:hypothetical protein
MVQLERGQLGEEPLMVLFLMKFNKATMLQGNGENASYMRRHRKAFGHTEFPLFPRLAIFSHRFSFR